MSKKFKVTAITPTGRTEQRIVRAKSNYDAKHSVCRTLGVSVRAAQAVEIK